MPTWLADEAGLRCATIYCDTYRSRICISEIQLHKCAVRCKEEQHIPCQREEPTALALRLLMLCHSCCMQNPQNHTALYVMGVYSVLHTYNRAPQVHWRVHASMSKTVSAAQPQRSGKCFPHTPQQAGSYLGNLYKSGVSHVWCTVFTCQPLPHHWLRHLSTGLVVLFPLYQK